MSQGGGLDGQLGIELMVERAAAGKAPSSPQPPEAGARRARLYGASPVAERIGTDDENYWGLLRSRVAHPSGSRIRLLRHAATPARPSGPHAATTKLP